MEEEKNKGQSTTKTKKASSSKKTNNVTKKLKKDTKEKLLKSQNEEIIIENVEPVENKEVAKKEKAKNSIFAKPKLKIIPLGGLNEIGKNLTVFEYENEIIVVDCGLAFPEDEMLGVDIVIPDITYLEKNKEKIKAVLITHGHEDHIGAIPYFLKKINVPIGRLGSFKPERARLIASETVSTASSWPINRL